MLAHFWQASGESAAPEEAPASGNSRDRAKKSARAAVLVVDDEPLIRWAISETLADRGYEVAEAADAASAIEAVGRRSFAAVLLDLRLPDCDDLRTLAAIRRLLPNAAVVLVTAYGTPEVFSEARRLGAFAILDKPFEIDAIPAVVRRALASRPH
jgi:DNA-binding NtrC family response regulator